MRVNIFQETFQGGPIDVSTREAAVIVVLRKDGPPELALAFDVRLSRLALGIERIEFLFEPFFG